MPVNIDLTSFIPALFLCVNDSIAATRRKMPCEMSSRHLLHHFIPRNVDVRTCVNVAVMPPLHFTPTPNTCRSMINHLVHGWVYLQIYSHLLAPPAGRNIIKHLKKKSPLLLFVHLFPANEDFIPNISPGSPASASG